MKTSSFNRRKVGGIVLSAAVVGLSFLLPPFEALDRGGITALAVLLGAVVLWVTDALPAGVTGLLALAMMIVFGIATAANAFAGIGTSSVAFTVSVFSLTIVLTKSRLAHRIISLMLRWAGADSKRLVLAFMLASAVLSSVMSNIAVGAMFMGIAIPVFKAVGAEKLKSRFARCVMLGIPVAAVNGGMGTPAGSSLNIVALGLYEGVTGRTIGFVQWMAVGYPFMLVMTVVCWFFIVRILKPEPLRAEDIEGLRAANAASGPLSAFDKRALVFLVGMPALWVLGNWVPVLNLTVVSIVGMALMFLPGVDLLNWDEFSRGVPWNIVLMMGAVISLGGIVGQTGGTEFIINMFLQSGVMSMNGALVILAVAAFAYFLHTVLPVGPAILTLFFLPLVGICGAAGVPAAVPTLMLAFILSGSYLIPVNPNLMVTYSAGYYTAKDTFVTGIVPTVVYLVLFTLWAPFIAGVLGLA